jgi:hypothetical protein
MAVTAKGGVGLKPANGTDLGVNAGVRDLAKPMNELVDGSALDLYLGMAPALTGRIQPALPDLVPKLPLKEVIGSRQVVVAGRPVGEEVGVNLKGRYVAPNELLHVLLTTIANLGREGALISVGTFRAFGSALAMGAKEVVLLDYDRQTTRFNGVIVDLIKSSPDRHTFLARLLGFSDVDPIIQAAREGASDPASQLARDQAFEAALRTELDKVGFFYGRGHRQPVSDAVDQHIWSISTDVYKVLTLPSKAPQYWQRSWMGSDAAYAELRTLVEGGHFVPLNGSLTGTETLPSIAAAFTAAGKKVSVLDLSNAMDYMTGQAKGSGFGTLRESLEAIPFSENARVLLTAQGDRYSSLIGGHTRYPEDHLAWDYVSLSARDFKEAARLGYLYNQASVNQLYLKVREANTSSTPNLLVPREGFLEGKPYLAGGAS